MALTNCRDCAREMSTQAYACPHCGGSAPVNWKHVGVTTVFMVAIGLFGTALAIGARIAFNTDSKGRPLREAADRAPIDKAAIWVRKTCCTFRNSAEADRIRSQEKE